MVGTYAVKGLKRKKRDGEKEAAAGVETEESTVTEPVGSPTLDPAAAVSGDGTKPGVVFVLGKASLEFASVRKTDQLLNSDDHANFFEKHNLDLLLIAQISFTSPVNKSARVRALYVHTEKNKPIQVNTHKFGCQERTNVLVVSCMLQVLQNKNIRTADGSGFLLCKVENPVTPNRPIRVE